MVFAFSAFHVNQLIHHYNDAFGSMLLDFNIANWSPDIVHNYYLR